jgi:Rad3-related DNA helicase
MYQIPNTPPLRPAQAEALEEVRRAFAEGYETVIIQAPTGTGKTLLGRYIADGYPSTLVGVPTRALQDQYSEELLKTNHVAILKGKANYECTQFEDRTAENAPCQNSGSKQARICQTNGCCPYIEAKQEAIEQNIAVLSFGGLLCWAHFSPETFGSRELRIIDEAHKIEDIIRDHFSTEISEHDLRQMFGKNGKKLPPMPHTGGREELLNYLRDCAAVAFTRLQEILEIYEEDTFAALYERSLMEPDLRRNFDPVMKFKTAVDELFKRFTTDEGAYTVSLENKADKKGILHPTIVIKPIHLEALVKEYVLGPRNVFMSATLVGVHSWAKSLGITNYKFIDIPSSFPAKNRRAFFTPIGSLSKANIQSTMADGIKMVRKIAERPELINEKGLIHTPSYAFTKMLADAMMHDPRYIFSTEKWNAARCLEDHVRSSEPTILVGPSFTEGIDLKNDLCRFIIIWKCSYGNPTDPLVRLKVSEDKTWDVRRFLSAFVQQMGRGVRSKEDWAVSYIFDENLRKEVRKHQELLPKYVLEGIMNL